MKENTKTDDELRAIFEVAKRTRVIGWEKHGIHEILETLSRVVKRLQNLDMDITIEILGSAGNRSFNLCKTRPNEGKVCPISGVFHLGKIQRGFTIQVYDQNSCRLCISQFDIQQENHLEAIRARVLHSKDPELEASLLKLMINEYAREVVLNNYDTDGVFNQPYTPVKRVVPLHVKDPSLFKKM